MSRYPLVDAGMRELWATGWLHNKIRVVASSFCVKFLQLPWRWGMKYFWDTLLDADLESDVLGWQYISGSLPDGHELDRMENPHVSGLRSCGWLVRELQRNKRWILSIFCTLQTLTAAVILSFSPLVKMEGYANNPECECVRWHPKAYCLATNGIRFPGWNFRKLLL